jgi:hypothetical protein
MRKSGALSAALSIDIVSCDQNPRPVVEILEVLVDQ